MPSGCARTKRLRVPGARPPNDPRVTTYTRGRWLGAVSATAAIPLVGTPVGAQTTPLKIAAGQIVQQAQAYFAADAGFFEKHGITAEVSVFRGGAANAAAVAGGDMQFGVSSVLQIAQSVAHGLPFVIVAAGAVHDSRNDDASLIVPLASGITNAKQLSGKTVCASSLNGLDELSVRALIDKNGGDSSTVKFTEIPPVEQLAALLQGRIDGASMEDPERHEALQSGKVRDVGNGLNAIAPDFVTTAWFTTQSWLNANKDTARRFAAAMYEAGAWAPANPAKVAEIMSKYLKTTAAPSISAYAKNTNPRDFQPLLDVAARYKFLPPIAAASFVWDGK